MTAAHVAPRTDGTWLACPAIDRQAIYWCVVCCKPLMTDADGVYLHDEIAHPDGMEFDEDERPQ